MREEGDKVSEVKDRTERTGGIRENTFPNRRTGGERFSVREGNE